MNYGEQTFSSALLLLISFDSSLWEIILLSLRVSLISTGFALLLGLPLGALLALGRWPGRRALVILVHALMGMPPVVLGLMVLLLLARSGPLGELGLLFTPSAMVIAQSLLVTPIVASLSQDVFANQWQRFGGLMVALGRSRVSSLPALMREGRQPLMTAGLAAFGRAIAEIGTVWIVGGNIDGLTRVMTTAIALETGKGNLEFAVALGLVLLLIALLVNILVHGLARFAERGERA